MLGCLLHLLGVAAYVGGRDSEMVLRHTLNLTQTLTQLLKYSHPPPAMGQTTPHALPGATVPDANTASSVAREQPMRWMISKNTVGRSPADR